MTQPGGERRGDQVFTGQDTFDFGTGRSEMERMMRARNPFVVASDDPDQQPFIATEKGQQMIAGMVVGMYWGGPAMGRMARKIRRAKAARLRAQQDARANDDTADR
jgi:hypothetical protein